VGSDVPVHHHGYHLGEVHPGVIVVGCVLVVLEERGDLEDCSAGAASREGGDALAVRGEEAGDRVEELDDVALGVDLGDEVDGVIESDPEVAPLLGEVDLGEGVQDFLEIQDAALEGLVAGTFSTGVVLKTVRETEEHGEETVFLGGGLKRSAVPAEVPLAEPVVSCFEPIVNAVSLDSRDVLVLALLGVLEHLL